MSSNDFKTASTNLKMLSFSGGKPTLFSCVPFTVTVISSLLTDSQHNVSVVIIGCVSFLLLPPIPSPWEVKSKKKKNFFFSPPCCNGHCYIPFYDVHIFLYMSIFYIIPNPKPTLLTDSDNCSPNIHF